MIITVGWGAKRVNTQIELSTDGLRKVLTGLRVQSNYYYDGCPRRDS